MNFDPLRKMGARDAWKELDINNAKLIENMMKYLLEVIGYNIRVEYRDEGAREHRKHKGNMQDLL